MRLCAEVGQSAPATSRTSARRSTSWSSSGSTCDLTGPALVSVAYLSLQVSTDSRRRSYSDRPDERWFADGRRSAPGSSSLRAEAALAEGPRTPLRGDAGSGKTTLLQWLAVTAARSGFSGPLAGLERLCAVPAPVAQLRRPPTAAARPAARRGRRPARRPAAAGLGAPAAPHR